MRRSRLISACKPILRLRLRFAPAKRSLTNLVRRVNVALPCFFSKHFAEYSVNLNRKTTKHGFYPLATSLDSSRVCFHVVHVSWATLLSSFARKVRANNSDGSPGYYRCFDNFGRPDVTPETPVCTRYSARLGS